ncbi:MAG: class I SAM-dependent methyltransferase [Thioalkalivibrio sp.]|nr:class I SAM-dependent methyltransferase [Thioalkalivibrio sp.]
MLARAGLRSIFALLTAPSRRHRLGVTFADGETRRYFDGNGEADVAIVFRTARAERRAFWNFYPGLFEAYVEGEVDLLGERPILKLAELGHDALGGRRSTSLGGRAVFNNPVVKMRQLAQEIRQYGLSYARARENAEFHYGMSPEFFEIQLGDTVGYSEGYWGEGVETLNQAKWCGYDRACRKLLLEPGLKVAEVGAGWGYLPIMMAKRWGCDVSIYNPVARQNQYMRERFDRHELPNIRILDKDHRQLAEEPETYDRYVSIGVYEHVGYFGYKAWVNSIATALKPGGIGLLSTSGFMNRKMTEFLTLKYIFPGGHLPSLPLTLNTMDRLGLEIVDIENLWPHYQKTVACWLENVESNWERIRALDPEFFNERFRRRWMMYLSGTTETFSNGLDCYQITFTKGRGADIYPQTREFLYAAPVPPPEKEIEYWP